MILYLLIILILHISHESCAQAYTKISCVIIRKTSCVKRHELYHNNLMYQDFFMTKPIPSNISELTVWRRPFSIEYSSSNFSYSVLL